MRRPRVIMRNSVSLDGAVNGFEVNMELHYKMAARHAEQIQFIGSDTVKKGIEIYGGKIPPEEESDFARPIKKASLPWWVIPDTKGSLKGMLHYLRRFEFCRDVVLLVSDITDEDYIKYLEERNYAYYRCGKERVDYRLAFEIMKDVLGTKTVFVDAGPTLNGILLEGGFVDEISLLIHPVLVGEKSLKLFESLGLAEKNLELELMDSQVIEKKYLSVSYRVINS